MCVIVPDPKLEHAEVLPKKKLEVLQYNNFFILKYQDAASQWSKKELNYYMILDIIVHIYK